MMKIKIKINQKYFLFDTDNNPYLALIGAQNSSEAIDTYVNDVIHPDYSPLVFQELKPKNAWEMLMKAKNADEDINYLLDSFYTPGVMLIDNELV